MNIELSKGDIPTVPGELFAKTQAGVEITPNQRSGARVFRANPSLSAGIYAADFAVRPEILPRPSQTSFYSDPTDAVFKALGVV